MKSQGAHIYRARSLRSVAMKKDAIGQEHLRDALDVLNGSDLVIHGHDRDDKDLLINHAFEGVQVHESLAVYRNDLYGESLALSKRPRGS